MVKVTACQPQSPAIQTYRWGGARLPFNAGLHLNRSAKLGSLAFRRESKQNTWFPPLGERRRRMSALRA